MCNIQLIIFDEYIRSCWIETDRGAIWGFVAPVLFVITVSILYLTKCFAMHILV